MTLGAVFESVLEAARRGEEWAWSRLYRDLSGPVSGYLASRGVADPDDVASETFLQVARGIGTFEGDEASFRSWVFVIAHRRALDARRASSRRPVTLGLEPEVTAAAPGGDVEAEALASVGTSELDAALARLTEDQREVLLLRVVGDLSVADAAKVMGKSASSVRVLQHRALAALRDHLGRRAP